MASFEFKNLVDYLKDRYESDLRWFANYNSRTYNYKIRHVREDLKSDLKGNQLDYLIHRSLAVYNKRHAEEVYFHLGESDYLIVDYEKGTAIHLFLDAARGITVMLEPHVELTLPEFVEEWRAELAGD